MKKKLFFGLLGFGALLCGSLVSLVSLAPQNVNVREVRAEEEVPTITITQDDFIPDNVDPSRDRTKFIYFYLIEGTEGTKCKDIIPYVSGSTNRFMGTNDVTIYDSEGNIKQTTNTNILKTGTIAGAGQQGVVGTKGMSYYSPYYFQIHGWGDVNVEDGDKIVLNGTSERKVDGVVDARIIFDNVSFTRQGDNYFVNTEVEKHTIDKDDISYIKADSLSGDIAIRFNTKTTDHSLVNMAWDLNHHRGYDFINGVTITPKDGEPITKDLNLIKEKDNQYLILSTSWADNSYWGDGFVLTEGTKINLQGAQTYKESYQTEVTLDLEFTIIDNTGNIDITGKEPFSVDLSNANISSVSTAHNNVGTATEYFFVDVFVIEDDAVIPVNSWATNYTIANGVKITTKDGNETVVKALFTKPQAGKYSFIFSVESWIGNFYDFKSGDTLEIKGTALGNSDGRQVTFNVDFTYKFPEPVEITFDEETVADMNLEKVPNADEPLGYYYSLSLFASFENELVVSNDWTVRYTLADGVKVTSKDGTVTTLDAVLLKPEATRYFLLFYDGVGHWLNNAYDFKPGDLVEVKGDLVTSAAGVDLTVHYDITYRVFDEETVDLHYETGWTLNNRRTIQFDDPSNPKTKGIYFSVNVEFADNDKAPKGVEGWDGSFAGNNDVTITRRNGESFKVNSLITEFANPSRLQFGFSYWSNGLSSTWDFENGDKIEFDTNATFSVIDNTSRVTYKYILHFQGTFYYAKDYETINPGPIVLAEEYAEVVEVENLINAIGEVTYPDSKTKIDEADAAYQALEAAQKSLVRNVETLEAAKASYKNAENSYKVNDTISKIDAIGEVTLDSDSAINAARTAYDALGEELKEQITNYNVLVAAEASLKDLQDRDAASKVDALIDAIGTVDSSDSCARRIAEARAAYENLTSTQASYVTKLSVLEAAEAQIEVEINKASAQHAIDAINEIGTVDGSQASLQRINNALNIYNSIGREAQAYVTNYETLTAAQNQFNTALNNAKADAISQIDEYVNKLNMNNYTEENQKVINDLVSECKSTINGQTYTDNLQQIVDSYIEQISAVKVKPAPSGCGGSIAATSIILSTLALAGIGLLSIKKRKED